MAKGKNTFNLYADMIGVFEKLPDDKAGQLIKHIFKYVNDQDPETNDLILNIAFEPIKVKLKRDLVAWTEKCEKNTENIRKRWNKNDTTVYDRIPNDTKHTDKDKDKDKDKENYTVNDFSFLGDERFAGLWNDYLKSRKTKLNIIGQKASLKKLHKYTLDISYKALEKSIESGYTGLFPESITEPKKQMSFMT